MAPAFDRAHGAALVAASDGSIHSVDLTAGTARWKAMTDGEIHSTPLVTGNRVCVAGTDKRLYALDAATGAVVLKIATTGKNYGSPRVIDRRIYFGSTSGIVYEFDPGVDAVTGQVQLPERITDPIAYSRATRLSTRDPAMARSMRFAKMRWHRQATGNCAHWIFGSAQLRGAEG
jgi:outer membrane protein assembly factor BamB